MNNFLNDKWEITGKDFDSFRTALKGLDERTTVKEIPMDEFCFLSVSDAGASYEGVPLRAENLWKKTKASLSLKRYAVEKEPYLGKYDEETVNESFQNGLFLTVSKKQPGPAKVKKMVETGAYVPVSEMAMGTISNRIKHFGYGFQSERLIRDLAIANQFNKPVPVTVVTRKENGNEKVFAVMSQKYTEIPQSMVAHVADRIMETAEEDLGKGTCSYWFMNHSITRIYIEFPEAGAEMKETYHLPEDMVPGIMMETSDIGDCSFRMKGYFRMHGTMNYMEEEFSQMHTGAIDMDEVLNEVETKIFPQYTWYPERLAELMSIDILDDSMTEAKRIRTISSLYRKVSRHIGLVKAIGKNREKSLMEQMIAAINPEIDYTAYDVAVQFLSMADCVDTESRSLKDAIARVAFSVLSYEFEKKEEEILLV